ncbi:PSP family protein [Clostridium sp. MCC353]|uniref:PSP family protein n=1 Tax=Clostridium sp. MCC353 TaxID=2592646 RepID=UPI001C039709|nr:PSP family protein [Clostridium sp. MCC353]MBT9780066.1 PSP family protein [Clostridium sp. MCC353]
MRKRNIWLLGAMLVLAFLSQACGDGHSTGAAGTDRQRLSAEQDSYTTDTRSTEFENKDEKLGFLRKYMDMPSDVTEAEYHIVYQDNSRGMVPGPSDWEIRAALQVEEKDIPLWTEGMKKILPGQVDSRWWEDLQTSSFTWEIPKDAVYYKRPGSQTYLVVWPDDGMILKFISTMYTPQETFTGHDPIKAAAAEALGYDESTIPFIETAREMKMRTAEGKDVDIVCLRAMFLDSPICGIPVIAVCTGGSIYARGMSEGSYEDEYFLADITGDGVEEILANHCVSITGGAGFYQSAVYQLDEENALKTLFRNPDDETGQIFDTGFGLHMSEDYVCTVNNGYTGSQTSFVHSDLKDSPYYDEDGNLTGKGRERNQADLLDPDPCFFIFKPVDTDGDGVYEIMMAQYSYLWGRADSLGSACTILKWSESTQDLYIADSRFLANGEEGEGDESGYDGYEEGNQGQGNQGQGNQGQGNQGQENQAQGDQAHENEPQGNHAREDSADSEEIRRRVCETIENMDFSIREYPLEPSFIDSEADKKYREAFYQAVTGQRPVFCRKFRSLEYEELYYPYVLNMDYLDEKTFLSQVLKQDSRYYYMDYEGDGFPELMVRYMGVYGFKYIPEEDRVCLYLDYGNSSYTYLMGAGQIYAHNPCIANKDMYFYSFEDRNGNWESAGFENRSQWDDTRNEYKTYYYVSADGCRDVEVSQDVWERLAGRLWDAYENAPAPMEFDELMTFFGHEP